MRVIVCGGRRFTEGAFLFRRMDILHAEDPITFLVEGGQRTYDHSSVPIGGADFFALQWALSRQIPHATEPAAWNDLTQPDAVIKLNPKKHRYDAMAGIRRNGLMLVKYAPIDMVVAFAPSGTGTQNMSEQASAHGIPVRWERT